MIGVTRNCDATLDLSWENNLEIINVLVSRFVSMKNKIFLDKILANKDYVILIVLCSGMNNTSFENNTPSIDEIKEGIRYLFYYGFRADRIILGVYPVFCNTKGIKVLNKVLESFKDTGIYKVRLLKLILSKQISDNFISRFGWIYDIDIDPNRQSHLWFISHKCDCPIFM